MRNIVFKPLTLSTTAFSSARLLCIQKRDKIKPKKAFLQCVKKIEKIEKGLKKLNTEEFSCPHDAKGALKRYFSKSNFYEVLEDRIEEQKKYESKGRPKEDSPYKFIYRITGFVQEKQAVRQEAIRQSSCFVIGTTIAQNVSE